MGIPYLVKLAFPVGKLAFPDSKKGLDLFFILSQRLIDATATDIRKRYFSLLLHSYPIKATVKEMVEQW